MKKLLFIGLLALSMSSFDMPQWSVLCEGTKNDGSKVKLINHDGKNYIIYYDKNDCQIGNSIETSLQPKDFSVWCRPMGYSSSC